jgi:hypothetical protein
VPRRKIPKPRLHEIIRAGYAAGFGPRAIARMIGYRHEHVCRIARDLGLRSSSNTGTPTQDLLHALVMAGAAQQ